VPLATFSGSDLLERLRVIREGNCYPIRYILSEGYYPIWKLPQARQDFTKIISLTYWNVKDFFFEASLFP